MAFFTPEFVQFFKDLAANNHKEWFDANRKRYEKDVKKPWAAFTDHIIAGIRQHDPEFTLQAKDAVTRINRDIRFSKDKTPYNMHVGAMITPKGRKDKSTPGLFMRFSPEEIRLYGGTYGPEKETLYAMREFMANNAREFEKQLNDPGFTAKFDGLHGDQHKRLPPEFREAAEKQPLIFNKSFYYYTILGPELILQDNVDEVIMDHYVAARPMKNFLTQAMKGG